MAATKSVEPSAEAITKSDTNPLKAAAHVAPPSTDFRSCLLETVEPLLFNIDDCNSQTMFSLAGSTAIFLLLLLAVNDAVVTSRQVAPALVDFKTPVPR